MLTSKKSIAILACVTTLLGAATAATALETTLAGIRLGAPGSDVLKRYGNPSKIVVGYVTIAGAQQNGPGGTPSPAPGGGGSTGSPLNPLAALGSYYNNLNNAANDTGGGSPALPGIPGLGMPGSPGPVTPGPGGPGAQPANTEQQITWTYDKGQTTLEFLVSDKGVVVQITAAGNGNFPLAKTTKGVKFGTPYKDVVMKYGFPEGHIRIGKYVRASYADKDRVVFTFLKEKVVAITVALKLDD